MNKLGDYLKKRKMLILCEFLVFIGFLRHLWQPPRQDSKQNATRSAAYGDILCYCSRLFPILQAEPPEKCPRGG